MVRIRLKRTGTRNRSCFRVVVMDQRSTRDGRSIEEIGFYDPNQDEERMQLDRYDYWVANGAQPSQTVADIARRIKNGTSTAKTTEKVDETPVTQVADEVSVEKESTVQDEPKTDAPVEVDVKEEAPAEKE